MFGESLLMNRKMAISMLHENVISDDKFLQK